VILLVSLYFVIVKVLYTLQSIMFHERTKHIDVRHHYIQGVMAQGSIKVCKVDTHDNPVDMMIKYVRTTKFELFSRLIGVAT
jgi:hypothetical protein